MTGRIDDDVQTVGEQHGEVRGHAAATARSACDYRAGDAPLLVVALTILALASLVVETKYDARRLAEQLEGDVAGVALAEERQP